MAERGSRLARVLGEEGMRQLREQGYILFPSALCPGRTYKLSQNGRIYVTDVGDGGRYRAYLCVQTAVDKLHPDNKWSSLLAKHVTYEQANKFNGSEADMVTKVLLIRQGELQLVAKSPVQRLGVGGNNAAELLQTLAKHRCDYGRHESTVPLARVVPAGSDRLLLVESIWRWIRTRKWERELSLWKLEQITQG